MRIMRSVVCAGIASALMFLLSGQAMQAQTRVPARITAQVDDTRTVELKGNVHPLARPEFDRGAVGDAQPMTRMLLLLQRSPEQETALKQLMDEQQTKGSANYHTWLTPEQFGKQFGPADADVQAVTDWLARQGFQVAKVSAGRNVIEFSGNVAQVRNAFHTEVHRFAVKGEEHVANVSEPAIPEALAPVVKGVVSLNDFPRWAHLHNKGLYRLDRTSNQIKPLFTFGNPANFAMAPADFAKVYSIPNYNITAGVNDGTGVTIAIVGQSNINAQDVIDFRNLFGLPQNFTQAGNVIINGPDPGLQLATGDEGESILDVEWAGAVAPGAKILLVSTATTQSNPGQIMNGTDLSALYIVDNNLASVLSESYGQCEPTLGAAQNQFFNALWEQAAAQGITVVVSAGDSGSAGCDPDLSPNEATDGLAVSGIASTPFNTAVGGTDFDPSAEPVTPPNQYWSATNGTTNGSALMYIPETTWDDSTCAFKYPQACNSVDTTSGADISAAGGGPSNCAIFSGSSCSKGYAAPAYQIGVNKTGFTNVRTIPDVSFFASNGGPLPPTASSGVADIVCEADINPSGASCNLNSPFSDFSLVGGTSAATPPFAGILALLIQSLGVQRLGNVNYGLYAAAANDSTNNYLGGGCRSSLGQTPGATCVFNDVTNGNIAVACAFNNKSVVDGSTNWCQGSGTFGVTVSNNAAAFGAGTGYDLATGLGSINVTNLLARWSTLAARTATTTTISNPSGGTPSGTNFTAKVTVSPAPTATTPEDVSVTALASDGTTVLGSFGPFSLTSGSFSGTITNLLPPGTAFVSAYYGGDATHGASSSAPLLLSGPVAGAGYTSTTQLNFVTFDSKGNPVPTTKSKTVAYGSPYILNAIVFTGSLSNNNNPCGFNYPATKSPIPCPTGTITLTDNGNPLNDFPNGPASNASNQPKISNEGLVEDAFVQLTGGTHSIVAKYPGDGNYSASTSNTLSVTITPAQTITLVTSSLGVITSGTQVILTAAVTSTSNSLQGPTGNLQFTNGSTSLGSAACTPSAATASAGASCTAQLTASISALYPPTTREPRPTLPLWPMVFAALSIVLFAMGWRWMPEKRRRAYAYAGLLAFAVLVAGIAGCGGGGGGSHSHTATIKATYAGDTNYATSNGSTTITVN